MTDDQPAQPLTDAELAQIREDYEGVDPYDSVPRLLAEVDRLRAENDQMRRNVAYAAAIVSGDAAEMLPETIAKLRARVDRLSAENSAHVGVNMACNAKIDRLQSERDALVRKLGLDWGPDEFGDLSAVPDAEKPCLDSPDWSCRLGPRCVCSKYEHDTRHECACGSWWYSNE